MRKNQDNDYFDSILNGNDKKGHRKSNKKYYYNKYNTNYDYNNNDYYNYNNRNYYNKQYYDNSNYNKKKEKYDDEYYLEKEISEFPHKIQQYLDNIDQTKIIIPEHTLNLIQDLIKNKLDCMICEEKIKNEDSVWSCNTCYTIYHLKCIEEWISKKNPNDQKE